MKETVVELFEKEVEKNQNNVALIYENEKITYGDLNKKVNKLAHYLIEKGVEKDDKICVVMDHSIDMIISIFGIIKAGATYIPMEPTFPIRRINYIIEESNAKFVVTQQKYFDSFDNKENLIFYNENDLENLSDTNPYSRCEETTILYVLYTSGTTGRPKGVMVQHKNVYNYINAFKKFFKINSSDRMLQSSVCTFDIFVEELFPIIMTGGTLVIANSKILNNSEKLFKLIKEKEITITSTFPYFLNDIDKSISDINELPDSWKIAISGGDTLRKEFIKNISKKIRVFNTYGPTETTVCASYYEYNENYQLDSIPVGKPIENVKIYLLDENLNKVNDGEVGEICISGKGVSRGYLNLQEKTNENFIVNPYDKNERLYRTGDLGRVLPDGNIDFIKRKDQQIMIEGKRVEPLEVENIMLRNDKIKNAIVRSYQDENNYSHLTAYLEFNENQEEKISQIKNTMKEYLPNFMIPETFIKINQFPLTMNGKIDRRALPVVMQ